jgi:hypothetical protein
MTMKDFEQSPPVELTDRVVRRLRAEGLLRTEPRSAWLSLAAGAAALVLAFAAGWYTANRKPDEDRYLLLLYGTPAQRSEARVEEYRAWAAEQRRLGRDVRGERLGPSEVFVGQGHAPSGLALLGFFLVSADGDTDAAEVARSHPHVRHGGAIVVRPIDPP